MLISLLPILVVFLLPLFALKFERAKYILLLLYVLFVALYSYFLFESSRGFLSALKDTFVIPLLCFVFFFSLFAFNKPFFMARFYFFLFFITVLLNSIYMFFIDEIRTKAFYVDKYNYNSYMLSLSTLCFLSLLGLFALRKNSILLISFAYLSAFLSALFSSFYFST